MNHEPTKNSPDETRPLRIAVVGGGITGLSAAHRLTELAAETKRPVEISLFEASDRLGGLIGTREVAGYRVETGADSFITDKPWALDLAKRLGLADRLISTDNSYRRSFVLHRGKPELVPEGFMLLAPAKIWPVLTSPLLSVWGKIRLGCEFFIPRGKSVEDESLADFTRRRFGREVLDRIVQPLVGGIYTSVPEKLSLRATMPRFLEMEAKDRSLIRAARRKRPSQPAKTTGDSGARYGLFVTFKDGISELVNALAASLSSCQVRMSNPVKQIVPTETGGALLELADGDRAEFDRVILTLPAYRSADLVDSFAGDLAGNLRSIEFASSTIVVSGHRLADVKHPLDAFGMVVPAVENRKVLAVSFRSRKFPTRAPEGCVQLRTFVGGAMQPELFALSDEEMVTLVRQELSDMLGVTGEPQFVHVARYERAMPQYHVGHLGRVERIEAGAATLPFLEIAGNAFRGVGLPDCVHSGEQAAERAMSGV